MVNHVISLVIVFLQFEIFTTLFTLVVLSKMIKGWGVGEVGVEDRRQGG